MKKYFICLLSSLVLFLCVSYFVGQYPSQSTQERLREHAAEASLNLLRTTRQAIATHLHVLHRALVGATLTAIYHYVRLGGRGAWLLPRLLLLPFIR